MMKPQRKLLSFLLPIACFLLPVLLSCHSAPPPPTPLNQLTAQQTHGHQVFQAHCSLCHYDRSDETLHGPSLINIFKKPYLHSGAPATDEHVTQTILNGRNLMPAQRDIDPADLDDLMAYLHTL